MKKKKKKKKKKKNNNNNIMMGVVITITMMDEEKGKHEEEVGEEFKEMGKRRIIRRIRIRRERSKGPSTVMGNGVVVMEVKRRRRGRRG